MKEAASPARDDDGQEASPRPKRRLGRLLILAGIPLVLLGGAGAAWVFVPAIGEMVSGLIGGHAPPRVQVAAATQAPVFVDLPEMAVTLPNGGRPRQMRIKLSLELTQALPESQAATLLSPRVYDSLLTYLRTLRDGEVEGSLAIDRLRADLYRRLTLLLGAGTVRDVLVTSLVIA